MKKIFFLIPVVAFIFTCSLQAGPFVFFFSSPTDHFRSVSTGDWGASSTWESSPDNINWFAATLVPTSAANIISIRNGHTVTVSTSQDMDQLIIESGGILIHTTATLTITDGAGDDLVVQGGGVFVLASAANAPVFSPATATANINTGGTLRLSATGLTGAGVGVNAPNYIYSNASILEYTLIFAFSTSGVTYFPNADAVTIPIFRITNNVALVGSNTFTTINGLFEANGNISFHNSGTKTFRNGITGAGNVNGSTSGKFIINGATAVLGGAGLLTLPAVNGMDIGTATSVMMLSDKSINGNIALLSNTLLVLGSYNLTMTGNISGGSATSHIVTNSSGKLVMNNIGTVPVNFPIGANTTTINPIAIYNGGGLNYGSRVETGINPSIRFPVTAVNRTWFVTPTAGTPGIVNTDFFYSAGDGNTLFNYTANLELGFYTSVWNIIQTGLVAAGSYQVAASVNNFVNNMEAPLVLANLGAILDIHHFIQLSVQKQNDQTVLRWMVNNGTDILQIIPERSADGRIYKALAELTTVDTAFIDLTPLPGLNYYRLKMKDKDGKITYSNIAVILNAGKGFELISITPNPVVNGHLKLNISAAERTATEILITDMQGRVIQKLTINLTEGFNTSDVNVKNIAAGTYQLFCNCARGRSKVLRFVIL